MKIKTIWQLLTLAGWLVAQTAGAVLWTGPVSGGSGPTNGVTVGTATTIAQTAALNATNADHFYWSTNAAREIWISARGIANGLATSTNDGLPYGPDTAGSTTYGIAEAWASVNKGSEYGPKAVSACLRFTDGYFYFTNALVFSNNYTTGIKLQGNNMLGSKLVYAGSASGINCIDIRGGGNPRGGDTLDLPMHVFIQDLGFSAINETTNVLLRATNVSHTSLYSVNFTSWRIMTNNSWGSAMSINGGVMYSSAQGLVGCVLGNNNDHATFIRDCYWAGLAVGGEYFTDHLYADGMKFAFIGYDGGGTPNNLWPATHRYSLGAAIIRQNPTFDSYYKGVHFYACNAGFANLNPVGDLSAQMFYDPSSEGCDHPYAAQFPNAGAIVNNMPLRLTGNEDNDMWRITNSPTYAFINVADNVIQHSVYTYGDGKFDGSGLTNAPITAIQGSGGANTAATNGTAGQSLLSAGNGGVYWGTASGGSGATFKYDNYLGGTNTGNATLELRNTNGFAVVVVTNLSGGGSGVLLRSANGAANKYNQTDFETRQGNQIMRFFNTDADQADGGEWMYWNTGSGLMMGAAGGQTAIRGGGITTGVLQVDGSGVISSGGAGQTFLWGTNAATGEVTNRGIGAVSSYIATTNGAAVINANKTAGLLRVLNNGVSTVIDSNTITTGRLTVSGSAGVGGSATNFGRYTQLGQFGTAGWNGFMFDTNTGTFSISRSSDGATTASMAPSIASVGTFRGSAFDNSGQTASMNLGTANHIKWFVGTALGQTIGWANTTNVSFTTNLTAASVTGTNFLALATNYVAANFVPISGQVKFCASNRAVYAVSDTFTNLITGP